MNEIELIHSKIYDIRGQKVMLDYDLAEMYGVETRVLNQAVKRNSDRFPYDFMMAMRLTTLEKNFEELKQDLEDIFSDYNDINEDTRAQLDAINIALADLQTTHKKAPGRRRIGFNTEE